MAAIICWPQNCYHQEGGRKDDDDDEKKELRIGTSISDVVVCVIGIRIASTESRMETGTIRPVKVVLSAYAHCGRRDAVT